MKINHPAISANYIDNTRKLFRYYKSLGDKALAQVEEKHLHIKQNKNSNSLAVIVKHICGNMLSRWTDYLKSDGEKSWRNRDDEFVDTIKSKEELLALWEKSWAVFFDATDPLKADDMARVTYIRNEGHTVLETLQRQLGHYAYHIGQLVFLAKQLKETEWDTLSIAKGKSKDFNKEKFGKEKERKSFLDNDEVIS